MSKAHPPELKKYMDKRLSLRLNGQRVVTGILRGFDPFMNLVVDEAVEMGRLIASKGQISVQAGKEAVNAAYESTLAEGLKVERRLFHGLFATKDQKEGMTAFAEKRKPNFTHQ